MICFCVFFRGHASHPRIKNLIMTRIFSLPLTVLFLLLCILFVLQFCYILYFLNIVLFFLQLKLQSSLSFQRKMQFPVVQMKFPVMHTTVKTMFLSTFPASSHNYFPSFYFFYLAFPNRWKRIFASSSEDSWILEEEIVFRDIICKQKEF